jgi:hypothetical protein
LVLLFGLAASVQEVCTYVCDGTRRTVGVRLAARSLYAGGGGGSAAEAARDEGA